MDVQWLREYVQLCKFLNYRKAAEQLFITPSTLSKHVILLEKELGTQLLVRDTHSVALTEDGRLFRDSATKALKELDATIAKLNRSDSLQGELRIGACLRYARLNRILFPLVSQLEQKYPNVKLIMDDIQYRDYRDDLLKGNFDAVFSLRLPTIDEDGLEYLDLFSSPLCAWVSESNPLANRSLVTLDDLENQKMRILEEERCDAYRRYLKMLFAEYDLVPRMGNSLTPAIALDAESYGITPALDPSEYFGYGIRSILIDEVDEVTFSFVMKRDDDNPFARMLHQALVKAYGYPQVSQ